MALLTVTTDFLVPGVSESLPGAPASGAVRLYGGQVGGRPTLFVRAPAGRAQPLQMGLGRTRIAWAEPLGDAATISVFGLAIQTTGTLTAAAVANTNTYKSQRRVDALVTVAATTAVAGFRYNMTQWYRGDAAGRGGFTFFARFGITTGAATSTTRGYCGLTSQTAAPTDVDPSGQNNVCGFGWDSGDANISFMHKTGTGTVAKEALSGSWARPSTNEGATYECTIYCPPNGSTITYEITRVDANGTITTVRGSITTDLPSAATLLCPKIWASVGGTSSVIGVSLFKLYIESDT